MFSILSYKHQRNSYSSVKIKEAGTVLMAVIAGIICSRILSGLLKALTNTGFYACRNTAIQREMIHGFDPYSHRTCN